jgi:hypothetical protein
MYFAAIADKIGFWQKILNGLGMYYVSPVWDPSNTWLSE